MLSHTDLYGCIETRVVPRVSKQIFFIEKIITQLDMFGIFVTKCFSFNKV